MPSPRGHPLLLDVEDAALARPPVDITDELVEMGCGRAPGSRLARDPGRPNPRQVHRVHAEVSIHAEDRPGDAIRVVVRPAPHEPPRPV